MKKFFLIAFMFLFGCVSSGKYEACIKDVSNLKTEKEQLQNLLTERNNKINNLEIANKELETNLSKCELENKDNAEKLELCTHEKNQLINKKSELEGEITKLNRTLNAKQDELSKKIVELNNNLSAKDKELKSCNEQIVYLTNDIKNKDLTIQDLKKELSNLSQEKAKIMEEKEKAIAQLKSTYNSLVTELKEEIKKGEIEVTQLRDKLTLQMVEKILFDSGSAEIKGSGKKIIDRVAEILKNVKDKQIRIEGHTDNVPIGPKISKKFPTNWELSTARATTVVRYLIERGGINPKILSAVGYADNMPVASNDTEEGRAKNRRIEIVLSPMDVEKQ
ncbi:MAG: OmpA family protein [Proteobacteria bacterium]|nr:OmpA family protein [Pseudomonadota bacterium]